MKNVVVLRLSALGDVIHTIPAVVTLRDHANLTWVVEAPYRELVELVAGVATIPVRLKKWSKAPLAHGTDVRNAWRSLRGRFDEAIDFQGLIKSAVLMRASGARVRYGFASEAVREKQAAWFSNRHVHVDTTKHVVDQNRELALAAGGSATGVAHWDAFPQGAGLDEYRDAIVLLPGAGKANKLWPIERFRDLATRIGSSAVAVWGPGEQQLAEQIGARIAPPTNLRELAWLLQHARVVIGADTGPLHLADALGTKVIGLYGPTDPRRNGPYGQLDRCLDRYRRTKSMESISVEEVMNTLERVAAE
ncbi:MAG TPA: lipopolysaccharide heptosyltransferase I [Thermoanaerobaculia bacterium]